MATDQAAAANTAVTAEASDGTRVHQETAGSTATNLQTEGNGRDAPVAPRVTEVTGTTLNNLEVAGEHQPAAVPVPPSLSDETLRRYADELHIAVNRDGGFLNMGDDPDNKRIIDLLENLNAVDRQKLEEFYKNARGNNDHRTLRDELRQKCDGDAWRKAEAILNRTDGRTNDAGNLMVALSAINDDRGDAERRVLETFATLNSDQVRLLNEDFRKHYGISIDDALKQFDVSGDTMRALEFMRKPANERTAADIEAFARFSVEKRNIDFLSIALRGDSPEAREARANLQKDTAFNEKLVQAFMPQEDGGVLGVLGKIGDLALGPIDEIIGGIINGDLSWDKVVGGIPVVEAFGDLVKAVDAKEENYQLLCALDILKEGRISLATIALNNTGSIFGWFDNKDNIKLAVSNATDQERQAFAQGRELALANRQPATDEERNALEFYTRLHKALEDAGNAGETATWEDHLVYKGSVIGAVTDAGDRNGRFTAVENMSQQDWQRLNDPVQGPQFRRDIETYLNSAIGDQTERARLLQLIDQRAAAASFEQSEAVRRSLFKVIEDNRGSVFLGLGTDYNGSKITPAIVGLSAADAQSYKEDEEFRAQVDRLVNDSLEGSEKALAHRLLQQVMATGAPPVLTPADQVLQNAVNKVEPEEALPAIESMLSDPTVRERILGQNYTSLNQEDRELRRIVENLVRDSVLSGSMLRPFTEYMNELQTNGRLPVDMKAELGLRGQGFFEEAAKAPAAERVRLFEHGGLSADEKALIQNIADQSGTPSLADQMRSFVLGDGRSYEEFREPLSRMTNEQKQQLREEYTLKYGALDDDFMGKIDAADRNAFRTLLTAGATDGRQDFYDNLERALRSKSGFAPDGSELTLDRAVGDQATLLKDFQSRFEQLPQSVRDQANQYFAEALEDYQQSKEQFAEKLYQAAVLVGGLAVAIGTGGVGIPALLAVAAVAAAGRIALKKAVMGEDYELSLENCLRDAAIGAATGALSVIGPETIAGLAGVGRMAAAQFAGGVAKASLREGAERIVAQHLDDLVARAVVRGEPITEQALAGIAKKVAAQGVDPATLMPALRTAITNSGREVVEATVRNSLGGLREVGAFSTLGGISNVGIEAAVGLANGNLDVSNLGQAFAAGFLIGGGMTIGFKGLAAGARPVITRLTRAADGAPIISTADGSTVQMNVHTADGQVTTIEVNGQGTKLPAGAKELEIPGTRVDEIRTEEAPVQRTAGEGDGSAPQSGDGNKPRAGDGDDAPSQTRERDVSDGKPGRVRDSVPGREVDPQRIREIADEIARRQNEAPITPERFKQILDQVPQADRRLAMQILEESTANAHRRVLDHQIELLTTAIRERAIAQGKPVPTKITVVALSDDSAGKALGYLMRTNSDFARGVDIRVLDRATLEAGLGADTGPIVVLDDLGRATAEQTSFLKDLPDFYASDLGGFESGINLFDISLANQFPASMDELQRKIAQLVEEAKLVDRQPIIDQLAMEHPTMDPGQIARQADLLAIQQVLRRPLDEAASQFDNIQVVRPPDVEVGGRGPRLKKGNINEALDMYYRDVVQRSMALPNRQNGAKNALTLSEVQAKDVEAFLKNYKLSGETTPLTPAQQEAAAIMLRDGLINNSYQQMLSRMRNLPERIQAQLPAGKTMDDVVILTQVENNGSANLVQHLYGRMANLPSEQYASVAELAANPAAFKNKVIVYLDDYLYSGQQLVSHLEKPLPTAPGADGRILRDLLEESGADLMVVQLGGYKNFEQLNLSFKPHAMIYGQDGLLPQFFASEHLKALGFTEEEIRLIGGAAKWKDYQGNIEVGALNPYRSQPTNNPRLVRDFNQFVMKETVPKAFREGERPQAVRTRVDEIIWRGGAPRNEGDFRNMIDQTQADIVIDLRGADGAETSSIVRQRAWADKLPNGSRPEMVNIKVPTEYNFTNPADYDAFLSTLHQVELVLARAKAEGKTVFIHCFHGKDRTGLVNALHDVIAGGKTIDQALALWSKLGDPTREEFHKLFNREMFERLVRDYRQRYATL